MKKNPEREMERRRDKYREWEEEERNDNQLGDYPMPPITSNGIPGPLPPMSEKPGWLPF